MSGSISADTIIGSNKTVNVNTLQQASDVTAAVQGRSGSAGAFSFRNKIVDGRFDFWYEGTPQTSSGYGSDTMFLNANVGSTKIHSQQTLTPGVDLPAIEVPSAKYFSRTVVTSVTGASNYVIKWIRIEDVRTLAGKTATLSFYAKADTTRNISVGLSQYFGSSGSTQVNTNGSIVSLSNSWVKYSVQFTLPSISGKTIGTGDFLVVNIGFDLGSSISGIAPYAAIGQQSGTFDLACVQLEEGSVMTPFEELPIEVSQQRVNRYYQKVGGVIGAVSSYNITYSPSGGGVFYNANIKLNGVMRTTPTCTTSLSDSTFSTPTFTDGQWGLVLDGYAWSTKNGTLGVAVWGTRDIIHLSLFISGTLSVVPSAVYLVGSAYMAADARL